MDMTTTRIIFAVGVLWRNTPHHGDIPVAYTHASPEENSEIDFHVSSTTNAFDSRSSGGRKPVLKLMKSIYGLKQAGCLWNQMLDEKLRD
jgi:hypothetical protein